MNVFFFSFYVRNGKFYRKEHSHFWFPVGNRHLVLWKSHFSILSIFFSLKRQKKTIEKLPRKKKKKKSPVKTQNQVSIYRLCVYIAMIYHCFRIYSDRKTVKSLLALDDRCTYINCSFRWAMKVIIVVQSCTVQQERIMRDRK